MRTFIIAIVTSLSLSLSAGCGDDASCENVVDHTVELMPAEFKSQLGDKSALVAKCEKEMTEDQRKCAMDADSFEALMKCSK